MITFGMVLSTTWLEFKHMAQDPLVRRELVSASNQTLQCHVVTIRCYPWSAGSWQVFHIVGSCVFSHQSADYSIVVAHLTSNSFEGHPCCMHANYGVLKNLFILSKHSTKANIRSTKMANNWHAYNRDVLQSYWTSDELPLYCSQPTVFLNSNHVVLNTMPSVFIDVGLPTMNAY
jgi:hypothetical protein